MSTIALNTNFRSNAPIDSAPSQLDAECFGPNRDARNSLLVIKKSDPLFAQLQETLSRAQEDGETSHGVSFKIADSDARLSVQLISSPEAEQRLHVRSFNTPDGKISLHELNDMQLTDPVPEHYTVHRSDPLFDILNDHILAHRGSYPGASASITLSDPSGATMLCSCRPEVAPDLKDCMYIDLVELDSSSAIDLRRSDLTIERIEIFGHALDHEGTELRTYYTSYERAQSPFEKPESYTNTNMRLNLIVESHDEPGNGLGIGPVKIVTASPEELTYLHLAKGTTGSLKAEYHNIVQIKLDEDTAAIPPLLAGLDAVKEHMKQNKLMERPDYVLGTSGVVDFCKEHFYHGLPISVSLQYTPERSVRGHAREAEPVTRQLHGSFVAVEYSDILNDTNLVMYDAQNRRQYIPINSVRAIVPERFTSAEDQILYDTRQ